MILKKEFKISSLFFSFLLIQKINCFQEECISNKKYDVSINPLTKELVFKLNILNNLVEQEFKRKNLQSCLKYMNEIVQLCIKNNCTQVFTLDILKLVKTQEDKVFIIELLKLFEKDNIGSKFLVLNPKKENVEDCKDFTQKKSNKIKNTMVAKTGDNGLTILHLAVKKCDFEVVKKILENDDFDCNAKTIRGLTALHYTASFYSQEEKIEKLKIAKLLMQYINNLNEPTNRGWTPLHIAAAFNNEEIVELLIENGASYKEINSDGQTALDIAKENNHKNIIDLLSKLNY